MKTVSAIIPVYNDARFVGRAIESVLHQSYGNIEVIVVDDGSEDQSFAIASSFAGRGVRVIKKENGGPASARNLGVKYSHGEYLAFLDADDVWMPQKIRQMMDACLDVVEPCIVYTGHHFVDQNLRPLMGPSEAQSDKVYEKLLRCKNQILPSTMMISREVFDLLGGFPEDQQVRGHEDAVFALMAARQFRSVAVKGPLTLYFYSDSGLGRSAVYDYAKSVCLQRAVFACVQDKIGQDEFEVFESAAWVNTFCKFAMHGQLCSARRLKREMRIKTYDVIRSARGILALLSIWSGINILFWSRRIYQHLYNKLHQPIRI